MINSFVVKDYSIFLSSFEGRSPVQLLPNVVLLDPNSSTRAIHFTKIRKGVPFQGMNALGGIPLDHIKIFASRLIILMPLHYAELFN